MEYNIYQAILFFIFVIVGSIIIAWVYRKIVSGITREKIDRTATKYGKYGSASEKIVKKR